MRRFLTMLGVFTGASALAIVGILGFTELASATTTTPLKHVYNGHLLDSSGNAVTSQQKIRFSYWTSADYVSGDVTSTGAINTSASTYANWYEVFTVTPDSRGYFSVQLGSGTALPTINSMSVSTLTSLFLQVEVKSATAADTAYELLDRDTNDPTVDRSPVLAVPSALNADMIDRRDVGTGSGAIPVLQSGGVLQTAQIPGGTDKDNFTIDNDASAATGVTLKFGKNLNQFLTFDVTNDRFDFNDDVRVQGNLTVTGLVNGVNISTISTTPLRVASGAGLTVSIASGSYRINGNVTNFVGSGSVSVNASATNTLYFTASGLIVTVGGFPTNISYIPLARVVTSAFGVSSVTDRRALSSDDRQRTVEEFLHPEFPNVAYKADGSSNVGRLWAATGTGTYPNFYVWTSTLSSLQDYDINLRVTVPSDFIRWKDNPLEIAYRTSTSDASGSHLGIAVFDTAGTAVTLSGSVSNLVSTSWTTTKIEFTGTPTWTTGSGFLIRFRVRAKSNEQVHVGSIKIQHVELLNE